MVLHDEEVTITLFRNLPKRVIVILLLAGCARLLVALVSVNPGNTLYWEYGELARNVLAGRGYSLFYFSGNHLQYAFNPDIVPFPSAYMSPGYVGFLLPFLTIGPDALRNLLIIIVQICLSLVSLLLLYRLTTKLFSEKVAVIAVLLAGFLPDFVYASVSFTPTVLFHCCLLGLFLLLYDGETLTGGARVLVLSLLCAALSYLRFEILLFIGMVLLVMLAARRWKEALATGAIVVILLTPWVIRSSLALDGFVPTGTGFGLNLYRGNNPDEIGSWVTDEIISKIAALPRDRSFELSLSNLYTAEVMSYVREQPARALAELPVKFYQLWVFSPVANRAPFVSQLTSWGILLLFIIGFSSAFSWEKYRYLYLFLLFSTLIGLIFFSLPRHQTMMRVAVLPFAAFGVQFLLEKIWALRSRSARQ